MASSAGDVRISPVESESDRSALRALLATYHEWMASTAPGPYDPDTELAGDEHAQATESESWAWVASLDGDPVGCVLCYGDGAVAEFRRLWVDPAARGRGVGRRLVETVIEHARSTGYDTVALATPPWSEAAHALYESLGFERTGPFPEARLDERYHDDAIFMQLSIGDE